MAIKISRIEKEFIFKSLLDQKSFVELQLAEQRIRSFLIKVDEKKVYFRFDSEKPKKKDLASADLYIPFKGTRITCRLIGVSYDEEQLTATLPEVLYRDLSRGFERIRPSIHISLALLLEGVEYKMDLDDSEEYYEPEPPSVNIKFDAQKITNLLKTFREKAQSFSSENKIIMFRERKPNLIPEELLAWSGRTLLLPLSDGAAISSQREGPLYKILDQDDLSRIFKASGRDSLLLSQSLSQYVESMFHKKIWHELYCPLLFKQYVVGYIYLMRSELQTTPFSLNTLEFVNQFSRLLSYSLHQNGYFQLSPVREQFEKSELVDVSGSGLLFCMPVNGPALDLFTDVDLKLGLDKKTINIKGRVMRRFQDSGRIYVGIKFIDIDPSDYDFIISALYGSKQLDPFSDDPIVEL